MMKLQRGFTLVEIAIVLVIVGILIGGFMMPLGVQIENKRRVDAQNQIEQIKEALIGFAMSQGRLPCPSAPNANPGEEAYASPFDQANGICQFPHGLVPYAALGINGPLTNDNTLADSWNNPIHYSVAINDADLDGTAYDFTRNNGFTLSDLPTLAANLVICDAASTSATDCQPAGVNTLYAQAPAVIYSMGKNWNSVTSADEIENAETTFTALGVPVNPGSAAYRVNATTDRVFAKSDFRLDTGNDFDDIVDWISQSILVSRMIEAGQIGAP